MGDATWGTISPIQLAPGVRTIGELEIIDHIHAGLPLVDTRLESFYREGTIPSAGNLTHQRIADSIGALDPDVATVFFCNGPQCAATPSAIHTLIGAVHPAESNHLLPGRHPRLVDAGIAHPDTSLNGLSTRGSPAGSSGTWLPAAISGTAWRRMDRGRRVEVAACPMPWLAARPTALSLVASAAAPRLSVTLTSVSDPNHGVKPAVKCQPNGELPVPRPNLGCLRVPPELLVMDDCRSVVLRITSAVAYR
jgi:hypothetical protein